MPVESVHFDVRPFQSGDGPMLARVWSAAAPQDPITYRRFRDLFLLDRNFDREGLLVAEVNGEVVGAAYAVRRRVAHEGADTEAGSGWLPFFFVGPRCQREGIGTALLHAALNWLQKCGASRAYFSSYTPNYFLPGLDAARYPDAARLMTAAGFTTQYGCVAMHRSLDDYAIPEPILARIADLRSEGYRLESPTDDDLVDLIEVAGTFNSDWARGIREAVTGGLTTERIVTATNPSGKTLGWAMHGTYEGIIERFGPFGVLPESRGTGLGEVLLHLTLERMKASGTHSAWFLWTEPDSPAGHLYRKTGFYIVRTFSVLQTEISNR